MSAVRWLVEVAPIGSAEIETHCVDAETWQRALQAVRVHRGDASAMTGFSIELLAEGYRAVDPVSRLRFVVRSAPPETPVTFVAAPSIPPPTISSVPGTIAKTPSAPPRPSDAKSLPPPAPAATLVASAEMATESEGFSPVQIEAVAPVPQAPATERDVSSQLAGYPELVVAYRRSRDASVDAPLTYREIAYSLPRPVSEEEAEKILSSLLERVQAELVEARAGKFVNLALFDVVFESKPPGPPVATLAWKDWAKIPVVSYPRRRASQGGMAVSAPAPAAMTPEPPTPLMPQAQGPTATPLMPGAAELATTAAAFPPPQPPTHGAHAGAIPSAPLAPTFGSTTQPMTAVGAATGATMGAMSAGAGLAPQADPFAAPPAGSQVSAGGAIPISSRRISSTGLPAQRPNTQSTGKLQAAAAQRGRIQGDELIGALFEAMHDLHFLANSLEAGEFCLAVANEMIPARAGVVHVYDIMKRQFVVTCTSGAAMDALVSRRFADNDEMLTAAIKHKRALVISDARADANAMRSERFLLAGGATSVVVAPVLAGMRVLGAIELVNPIDGGPFTETDGHAMSYIAEQFCEFIGSHGLVMDPAQILARKSEVPRY